VHGDLKFDPGQKGTGFAHGCNEMDVMSALGQKRTFCAAAIVFFCNLLVGAQQFSAKIRYPRLFDHLVGA
jgi:hypothetical protein